jgi:hypothetical protein
LGISSENSERIGNHLTGFVFAIKMAIHLYFSI